MQTTNQIHAKQSSRSWQNTSVSVLQAAFVPAHVVSAIRCTRNVRRNVHTSKRQRTTAEKIESHHRCRYAHCWARTVSGTMYDRRKERESPPLQVCTLSSKTMYEPRQKESCHRCRYMYCICCRYARCVGLRVKVPTHVLSMCVLTQKFCINPCGKCNTDFR